MRPNIEAAIDFLVAMRPDLVFTLSALNKDDPNYDEFPTRTFHGHNQRGELSEWIAERQRERANLYWTPNRLLQPMQKKPSKKDIAAALFLFVDIDPEKGSSADSYAAQRARAVHVLRQHGATTIVNTGRGVQGFWRLEDNVDLHYAECANRAIAKALGGDGACWNIDHVYRLAGTVNFLDRGKRANGCAPALAHVVEHNERAVRFQEVLAVFGVDRVSILDLPPSRSGQRIEGPVIEPEPFGALDDMDRVFGPRAAIIARDFVDRDGTPYADRSDGVFAFCTQAIKVGKATRGQIVAALLHHELPLSDHIYDKCGGSPEVYATRQVERAAASVADELQQRASVVASFPPAPEPTISEVIEEMAREIAASASTAKAASPSPGPSLPAPEPAPPTPRDVRDLPVLVVAGQSPRIIDEVEGKLLASPAGQGIFQRAGQVVRLLRNEKPLDSRGCRLPQDMLRIVSVKAAWLEQRFEAASKFVRVVKPGRDGSRRGRPMGCPPKLAERYLANAGSWRLPLLAGIVTAPTLRADGSLLQEPGYDAATGLYFDRGAWTFPAVPAEPTREDALRALAQLAEPVRSFDFVADHDRSVWLAAVLTSLLRHSLPTSPLFTFNAPVMGSGKSTLADLVAIIATGHVAPCMTISRGEDETRKVVLSLLRAGSQLAVLDNLDEPLGSATIASVLTQQSFTGRQLGVNEMLDVPTTCLWLATGNNLTVEGDLVRRVVPCDLDPRVERPEARRFDFDPREVVRERRGELVVAALTVLRAFEVAGRPGAAALSPFGSFEAWSAAVRAPLVWLGQPDPLLGRERLQQRDPIETSLRRLLQAWHAAFGDRPQTIRQAIQAARTTPLAEATAQAPVGESEQPHGLAEAFAELTGTDRFDRESVRIGQLLVKFRGRIVDGLRLDSIAGSGGVRRWLVRVEGAGVGFGATRGVSSNRQENEE
jgi:hypothetical protein